jgi:hypothetical protein
MEKYEKCLFEECRDLKPFQYHGFSRHLKIKHNMSKEQYVKFFKTNELAICRYCLQEYFRSIDHQNKNIANTCGKKECKNKLIIERNTKLSRDKEKRKKANETRKKTIEENKKLIEENRIQISSLINLIKPRVDIQYKLDNQFRCLEKECLQKDVRFSTTKGIGGHIVQHHHLTMEEYCEKHNTNEWVCCEICGNFYRRTMCEQKDKTNLTCKNISCINEMRKRTTLQHFADKYPGQNIVNIFQTPIVKKKIAEKNKENYSNPIIRKEINEKRIKTNLKNTGYKYTFLIPENRKKCNSIEACQKRYETMKNNNSFLKSKPEDLFFEFLSKYFRDIKRQYTVAWWPIDFYIRDIDTFIQFDGEYLHGITATEDQLRESSFEKDKQRLHKKISDRRQNTYFKNRNISLLRITDKDFFTCESDEEVFSKLICVSGIDRTKN